MGKKGKSSNSNPFDDFLRKVGLKEEEVEENRGPLGALEDLVQNRDVRAVSLAIVAGVGLFRFVAGRLRNGAGQLEDGPDDVRSLAPLVQKERDANLDRQLRFAACRVVESRRMDRLIYDPMASVMTSDQFTDVLDLDSVTEVCLRSRYLDDYVRAILRSSVEIEQIVCIGSSLDTRMYRLELQKGDVQYFDVDRTKVLEYRERAIAVSTKGHKGKVPTSTAVAADYSKAGWDNDLIMAGYDWNKASLWVVDDAAHLTVGQLERLLRTACLLMKKGSSMVLTRPDTDVDQAETLKKLVRSCAFKIRSVTFVGDARSHYGRWTPDEPTKTCILSVTCTLRSGDSQLDLTAGDATSVQESEEDEEEEEPPEVEIEMPVQEQPEEDEAEELEALSTLIVNFKADENLRMNGNVCIVGNHDFIGGWVPGGGFPIGLASQAGTLVAALAFPSDVEEIEYKYVVVDEHEIIWEGGNNRKIQLNNQEPVEVHDAWYR